MIFDWASATFRALEGLWQGLVVFIPKLVGAILVFIIGWFISVGIGKLVAGILTKLKFNRPFEKGNWKKAFEKAEIKISASDFIGAIVKWVLIIVFLLVAVDILRLVQFAEFLRAILGYLGNVIIAALIFVVAVIVVDIVVKVVVAAAEGAKFAYSHLAGEIVRWAIWIFVFLTILDLLRIDTADWIVGIIQIVVAGIALMFALAFGLGGRDVAAEILQNLRKRLKG